MAHTPLVISAQADKAERYALAGRSIEAIIQGEADLIANLANTAAILYETFRFWWVGFYLRAGVRDELVLGPFQGPAACTRIPFSKGVCGAAATRQQTLIVPDVHQFPGHIACSSASLSEIVVPLVTEGITRLVLDVDSDQLNAFDAEDASGLEAIMALIANQHF